MSDLTSSRGSKKERELLVSFVEENPDPVLRFEQGGGLVYCNDAARAMAASLGRTDPSQMLPPELGPCLDTCLETPGKPIRIETSAGGRNFAWLFFAGQPKGTVYCQVKDITDRHQLQSQLRHAQK